MGRVFWAAAMVVLFAISGAAAESMPAKTSQKVIVKRIERPAESAEVHHLTVWSLALKKSHEIFREVWAHLWEDRTQDPMSVFLDLQKLVVSHKAIEDGRFVPILRDCQKRTSEVEFQYRSLGTKTRKDNSKESGDREIEGAAFFVRPCDRQGRPGNERNEVARVSKTGSGWVWTFYDEFLPRSAGQSLAFLHEKTRCQMTLDSRERLSALECQNLGQNRNAELHMLFSLFQYQKKGDPMLIVEGKKFKLLTTAVCDSPKFCTRVKVPLAGPIEIFEDTVSQVAREEREQAQREKERAEAAKIAAEDNKRIQEKLAEQKKMQKNGGKIAGSHGAAPPGVVPVSRQKGEPQFGDMDPVNGQALDSHSPEESRPADTIEEQRMRLGQMANDPRELPQEVQNGEMTPPSDAQDPRSTTTPTQNPMPRER